MWRGLIFSQFFIAPTIDAVEEWRLLRGVQKDLIDMRKYAASGHKRTHAGPVDRTPE